MKKKSITLILLLFLVIMTFVSCAPDDPSSSGSDNDVSWSEI